MSRINERAAIHVPVRVSEIKGKDVVKNAVLGKPHWHPSDCESCNAVFDEKIWKTDYSLSGELIWICPKCKHPSYPRLD
jgi:hypothetical protein